LSRQSSQKDAAAVVFVVVVTVVVVPWAETLTVKTARMRTKRPRKTRRGAMVSLVAVFGRSGGLEVEMKNVEGATLSLEQQGIQRI
jgi:hypothetical protein